MTDSAHRWWTPQKSFGCEYEAFLVDENARLEKPALQIPRTGETCQKRSRAATDGPRIQMWRLKRLGPQDAVRYFFCRGFTPAEKLCWQESRTIDRTSFSESVARKKGLTIKLVRRMKHTYPLAIELVSKGWVDVRSDRHASLSIGTSH